MTYTQKLTALPFIILLFLLASPVFTAAQVFVKPDAQGANNGTSWANAYTNLDSAINKTGAGEIWVAAGTYKPSVNFPYNSYPTFTITKNIALYGGFKGNETSRNQRNIETNLTILSGDVGVAGYDTDNTPKVLAIIGSGIDSTCIIDGFTIKKAWYTNAVGSYPHAAVHIQTNGEPVIRNCTIKDNLGFYGGGIYVRLARPLIYNNLITNNAAYEGAGIYLDDAASAKVIGNRIINNKCLGGYTHLAGGAIQVKAYCAPYIYGNLIDNNQSGNCGGGISVESNYSAVISNNIISNNTSAQGGGIYIDYTTTHLINNLIIGNKASERGGGLYVNYSAASRSVNNTIVSNSSDLYGGAVYLADGNMTFTNTIIYNNPTKFDQPFQCINMNRGDWYPRLEYCNVENGKQGIGFNIPDKLDAIWGSRNIAVSPGFIDAERADYRLRPQSACIDAGRPDTTGLWLPEKDIAGAKRFLASKVDMGCYEYDSHSTNTDSLIITPNTINVAGRSDSTFYVSIRSNMDWSITSTPDWVITDKTSGSGWDTLKVTTKINPSFSEARTGSIFFSQPGIAPAIPVKINQSGAAYLLTSPDTIYINNHINDTASFNVFSNLYWYFTEYPAWLSFNSVFPTGNATIVAKATVNNASGSKRIGQVTMTSYVSPAFIKRVVVVIQLPGTYALCQNGSDSISAGLNGTSYQWQVDTGAGFMNIADNNFYKGTNSQWLKLVNIPSSFNEYKYRCVAGSLVSDIYVLNIRNVWAGSASNQWTDPLNWSCGQVPDANTNVVITSGNIVVNADATIRTLNLSSSATVTVAAGVHLNILK